MSDGQELHAEIGRRIREAREERGVSLRTLARELEISPSALSLIERGHVQTPLNRIFDIARRLDMHPRELIEGPEVGPGQPLEERRSIRLDLQDQRWIREISPGETWEALDSGGLNITTSIAVYEPGVISRDRAWAHPGHEMIIVLEGRVLAELGDKELELATGDSVAYSSLIPHRSSNPFRERARFVTITSDRPSSSDVHGADG